NLYQRIDGEHVLGVLLELLQVHLFKLLVAIRIEQRLLEQLRSPLVFWNQLLVTLELFEGAIRSAHALGIVATQAHHSAAGQPHVQGGGWEFWKDALRLFVCRYGRRIIAVTEQVVAPSSFMSPTQFGAPDEGGRDSYHQEARPEPPGSR